MPVQNSDISKIFNQLADLLEIKGDNPFRIRAYRMAARNIGSLSDDVCEMIKKGKDLTEISGIGKELAEKIEEIVKSGGLSQLEEIKKEVPEALIALLKIEGLGPKRTGALYEKLGIENLDELEKAAQAGKIKEIAGFGEKTEQNILREIKRGGGKKGEKEEETDLSPRVAKSFGKQDDAGNLIVSDARLLLLPVRSLTGQYKWATCPYLLERLARDIKRSGLEGKLKSPKIDEKPKTGTVQAEGTGKVFLEEREFDIDGSVDGIVIESIGQLISNKDSSERLARQLIVLCDDDFKWFASYGLPINARNVLDENTKTSLNLWYEETLPQDCLFYTLFLERGNGAIDLVKGLVKERPYLQVGGNETVGQGWFALNLVGD